MSANPRLSVTYLGHLDYDAIDEQFRQSDIVTIPSQWPEPLGAVALEAMSAGAAVIASNVGGLNDTLVHDHNGLHVDPGDVTAWATAITTLLQDPDHAGRLGQQGHRDFAGLAIDDHLADLDHLVSTRTQAARLSCGLQGAGNQLSIGLDARIAATAAETIEPADRRRPRSRSPTPGSWMAHCHIAEHNQAGMMVSFPVRES